MILLVTGRDTVRVRERVQEFVDHFVQKYDSQRFNVEFVAAGSPFANIREQLFAAPFLAEKRMVVLSGFLHDLTKAEVQEWSEVFARLPSSTIVLVAEMVDGTDLEVWIKATGVELKAYPLQSFTEEECRAWLRERARRLGVRLEDSAWAFFFATVAGDATRGDLELQKLTSFADGAVVTQDDVARLVAPVHVDDGPFAFSNALGGSRSSVFQTLSAERARGVADFLLFGTLLRAARVQAQVKAILRQPVGDAAKELGLHPYVFKKESAVLGGRSLPGLLDRLRQGAALDRLLKRGLPPDLVVDRYLLDFL